MRQPVRTHYGSVNKFSSFQDSSASNSWPRIERCLGITGLNAHFRSQFACCWVLNMAGVVGCKQVAEKSFPSLLHAELQDPESPVALFHLGIQSGPPRSEVDCSDIVNVWYNFPLWIIRTMDSQKSSWARERDWFEITEKIALKDIENR